MFKTGYESDEVRMAESDAYGLRCEDESRAIQSAEEESNINTIVRRFGLTGELPSDVAIPRTGDFIGAPDFHTAMNLVRQAQEEFLRVPADIRARFNNDPGRFISFFEDESNRDEAAKLGLLKMVVPSAPEVVPEPPQN